MSSQNFILIIYYHKQDHLQLIRTDSYGEIFNWTEYMESFQMIVKFQSSHGIAINEYLADWSRELIIGVANAI